MPNHANFWIAVAAAAPVIALAAIVALTDTGRIGRDWYQDHPYTGDTSNKTENQVATLILSGYAAGSLNVILQALTLLFALLSLAAGHDTISPVFAEVTATLGIFLLLITAALAIALRFFWLRDSPPTSENQPPPAEHGSTGK